MTQPLVTLVTRQRIELDFYLQGAQWESSFDRLEVWRSRATSDGPYEALTDSTWTPAVLPVGFVGDADAGPGPYAPVSGKSLSLLVNEQASIAVTFSGTNPLSFVDAAAQVVTQGRGLLSSFVSGSTLVIQTMQTGVSAMLRCVGGDAAPLLGIATQEPGSVAFGRDGRIVLLHGQQAYGLVDPNGSPSYFYKTRFFNSSSNLTSDYSLPFQVPVAVGLGSSDLVLCFVSLVDMEGNPAPNQEVLIYNQFSGTQLEGKNIVGGSKRLLTDSSGRAEILLTRGLPVRVCIGGTALVREVTVPTSSTVQSINLLDPSLGSDDLFTVQVPNIPYATRRSL